MNQTHRFPKLLLFVDGLHPKYDLMIIFLTRFTVTSCPTKRPKSHLKLEGISDSAQSS